ncbi:MAG TPA: hypothetical protein VKM94_12665 [Blastocatellia bacterium]|nr:hypothetical protein [Blastocatellia bacterium]
MTRFAATVFMTGVLFFAVACTKGAPPADQSAGADKTTNSNASPGLAVLNEESLKGDTERASLALYSARQSVLDSKWNDAAAQLQQAQGEANRALARKPKLQPEWEDLRGALDRALTAVQARDKDSLERIKYAEAVLGGIKVKSGNQ